MISRFGSEPTYAGYNFGQAYLTHNGKRIGVGTVQDFEFVPDPDSDIFHMISYQSWEMGRNITFTCDFEPAYDLDVRMESMWPELGWQSFEHDLDRRLKWLW